MGNIKKIKLANMEKYEFSKIFCAGYLAEPNEAGDAHRLLAVDLIAPKRATTKLTTSTYGYTTKEKTVISRVLDLVFNQSCDILICGDGYQASKGEIRIDPIKEGVAETQWEHDKVDLYQWYAVLDESACLAEKLEEVKASYKFSTRNIDQKRLLFAPSASIRAVVEECRSKGIVISPPIKQETEYIRICSRHHDIVPGKSRAEAAYLIGSDLSTAQSSLVQSLKSKQIPVLPEWENSIWAALQQQDLVATLSGHQMAGYKIKLPRAEILDLWGEMIKNRQFPKPYALPSDFVW